MAERAHSHIERSCKPHLMQWVLQQEAPRKQVLLQVLTGTPERECASRLNMTLEQVRSIEQWFVRESPLFVEDDYAMSYQATRSLEEFCRVTRQDECVYYLMELRHPRSTRATRTAVTTSQEPRANARPSSPSVPANHLSSPSLHEDEAAKKRREERRAAREQERVRRLEEELPDLRTASPKPRPAATHKAKTTPTNPFDLPKRTPVVTHGSETPKRQVPPPPRNTSVASSHMTVQHGTPSMPRCEEQQRTYQTQPDRTKRAALLTSEEYERELVEMASAACKQCAEASVRPVTFEDFLHAFHRECNTKMWTAEAIPGNTALRRILEHDHRVMWSGANEFWFFDWKEHGRSIAQAIEHDALMGYEYSTRLFYRKERKLMRHLSVKTPEELYEILRRIYVDKDDEAVFGNHLSFGFGKIDRQRQIKHFVADRPGQPKEILAMEYEQEYGFSAGTAEIWINLFAQPANVSLSEWVKNETVAKKKAEKVEPEPEKSPAKDAQTAQPTERETVGGQPDWIAEELVAASIPFVDNRSKHGCLWVVRDNGTEETIKRLRAEGAKFRYAATGGRATHYQPSWWLASHPKRHALTAEQSKGYSAVPEPPATETTKPAAEPFEVKSSKTNPVMDESASVCADTESDTLTVTDFLKRELTGDICDASLVRARFSYEFPDKPDITGDGRTLAQAGYYEDHGLLFKIGLTPNEHFTRLLASSPSFSKGDPGFEGAVWKHQTFRYVLRGALASHQVLLYERPDSYISFVRLREVLDTHMADIESYAPAVCAAVPQKTPFTIRSLREVLHFTHPLDGLDMPDAFYEGLLDTSGLLRGCTMAGTKVFVTGSNERLSANSFMEWLISKHEGILREDVPGLLQKDYGIDYPMASVITTVYNSSVYHDDVGDAYYTSMEAWKQEARNELN